MAFSLSVHGKSALRSPELQRYVFSGVAWLLQHERDEAEVDRALKHLQLAIDAPQPDWVHLRVSHEGNFLTLREARALLPELQLSPVVERIEVSQVGRFEFDPAEAFERVVRCYTIDWSNFMPYAPTVRARFVTDPRASQEGFLDTFLELYEQGSDVTGLPGADEAAAWLKSVRRFKAQHTLVLRAPVEAPSWAAVEHRLRDALTALFEALARNPAPHLSWLSRSVEVLLKDPTQAEPGLAQVLTELGVPPPRRNLQVLAVAANGLELLRLLHPDEGELLPVAQAFHEAAERAFRFGW